MTQLKELISGNIRMIFLLLSFTVTVYIQHVTNTTQIANLTDKCNALEVKIEDQYAKIDAIKLDKAVFDANMNQFNSIQSDLKEMRNDIKELLKSIR